MQAPFEATEGRARLAAIISSFPVDSPHWNEAQNRFQFVDRLLTECLGWERPYIEVENSDELGGKADYVLGSNPPKAVLEAKREAKVFNALPIGKPSVVRKIAPLMSACKNLEEAVHQVIPYCALRGAPIAIVCNRPQLLIFQSMVIGQSPLEGECYLFNGFDSYLEYFPVLWSLLSPEGVAENRALRDLALHRNPRIPPRASTAIPEPMKPRYRSSFQENLRSLASLLLEDIEESPGLKSAFYRDCYVPIDSNNRHLLLSKRIISARYKRLTNGGVAPAPLESVATVDDRSGTIQISDPTLDLAWSARPVVVVGDVGVGKTSFFENLFERLDSSEKANTYFIHINLGIKANLTNDIKSYVLTEIPAALKRDYDLNVEDADFVNAIYYSELRDFDKGVKGALKGIDDIAYKKERIAFLAEKISRRDSHLHASLGHLAHGRSKQIILIIDNADQRTFAVQQEAFLIAQELAATRNLLVFVALRPSTFYQSKMTGALSGYQPRVLTIAPPPADEVLRQRITFAVRVAEGKIAPTALSGIQLRVKSIISFLTATLRAIHDNDSIKVFLANITGGNTRLVIELITSFCGSPNVDSEKIVRIEEEQGSYNIPLHEFTKHALLGEYAYYNPQSSPVACNVYDVSAADPREHFLAGLIIAYLASNTGRKDDDGFVSGNDIVSETATCGFSEDQVRFALRHLALRRLIETPHAHFREVPVSDREPAEQFHYRTTSIGVYHIRFWITSFGFLDATSIDTPIFDASVRGEVFKLAGSFDIRDRYRKADFFRKYLETQWHVSNINVNYFDFVSLIRSQDANFDAVKHFIEKEYVQKSKR
jgi:GTPase SAR1 family protein